MVERLNLRIMCKNKKQCQKWIRNWWGVGLCPLASMVPCVLSVYYYNNCTAMAPTARAMAMEKQENCIEPGKSNCRRIYVHKQGRPNTFQSLRQKPELALGILTGMGCSRQKVALWKSHCMGFAQLPCSWMELVMENATQIWILLHLQGQPYH